MAERQVITTRQSESDGSTKAQTYSDHYWIIYKVEDVAPQPSYQWPKRKALRKTGKVSSAEFMDRWQTFDSDFLDALTEKNIENAWQLLSMVAEDCLVKDCESRGLQRSAIGKKLRFHQENHGAKRYLSKMPQVQLKLLALRRRLQQLEKEPWNDKLMTKCQNIIVGLEGKHDELINHNFNDINGIIAQLDTVYDRICVENEEDALGKWRERMANDDAAVIMLQRRRTMMMTTLAHSSTTAYSHKQDLTKRQHFGRAYGLLTIGRVKTR